VIPTAQEGRTARGTGRWPGAALVLALAAPALLLSLLPSLGSQLICTRQSIAAGEPWRVLSGHWVHASADHLLWDLGAFVVLGLMCAAASRARLLCCVALSALVIPPALWLARPGLESYCGLSGIDSALFGLLVATMLRRAVADRAWAGVLVTSLLAAAFAAKVVWETCTSATLFVDSAALDAAPEPLSHAVGFGVGVAVALFGSVPERPAPRSEVQRVRLGQHERSRDRRAADAARREHDGLAGAAAADAGRAQRRDRPRERRNAAERDRAAEREHGAGGDRPQQVDRLVRRASAR
jgi:rhomboid family GlyGly-CTERM serine protease